jgi:hypothetical protein
MKTDRLVYYCQEEELVNPEFSARPNLHSQPSISADLQHRAKVDGEQFHSGEILDIVSPA